MFAFCEACMEFLLELFVRSEFHGVAEAARAPGEAADSGGNVSMEKSCFVL